MSAYAAGSHESSLLVAGDFIRPYHNYFHHFFCVSSSMVFTSLAVRSIRRFAFGMPKAEIAFIL